VSIVRRVTVSDMVISFVLTLNIVQKMISSQRDLKFYTGAMVCGDEGREVLCAPCPNPL